MWYIIYHICLYKSYIFDTCVALLEIFSQRTHWVIIIELNTIGMVELAEDFILSRFRIVLDLDIDWTELHFWFRFHLSDSKSRESHDQKMKPSLNRRKKRRKHFFVSIIILTIVVKSRLSTSREIPKKKSKTPDPSLSIWWLT